MRIALGALVSVAFLLAACGGAGAPAAAATVKTVDDAKLGKILVSSSGMTLYTYAKDTENVTNCYDTCATNWPALTLASGTPVADVGVTGKLATTDRKEGTKQVTWNGKPLYFYAKDKAAGDTAGDNVGTVWHVIKNP